MTWVALALPVSKRIWKIKTTKGLKVQALLGRYLHCGGRITLGLSAQTPESEAMSESQV